MTTVQSSSLFNLPNTASIQPSSSNYSELAPPHQQEADVDEIYCPGISAASLFVALPQTDGLTILAEKYLAPSERPERDLTGAYMPDSTLDSLINNRRWRSTAQYCHDRIVETNSTQTSLILSYWVIRLQALLRLHFIHQVATELISLFALLPLSSSHFPASSSSTVNDLPLHPSIPFELHVYLALLPALQSQGGKAEAIENLTKLIIASKESVWIARRQRDTIREAIWTERVQSMGIYMAALLMEMKAVNSATSLLTSHPNSAASPALLAALCRMSFASGQLKAFEVARQSRDLSTIKMRKTKILELVGKREWSSAVSEWRAILQVDETDVEVINNLAVCLLFNCKLQEAIDVLSSFLSSHPQIAYASDTLLFNYSILMELRTENAETTKVRLLQNVIQNGGEGVRPSCLKLA